MTLRYLEVFLELARTPNMRDVATRMFISQAAVSSSLRDFEAELGVELFDRQGRGIHLNEKGRLLELRLSPLYSQLRNVLSLVNTDELMGKLYVGATATLADSVIPQILYDIKMRYANVELDCQSGNTTEIVQLVENGKLDMGFVEGEVQNLGVNVTPLALERLVVVSADAELAAQPRPISELMGACWLLREPGSGTRETLLRRLTPLGLRPNVFLELEQTHAIKQVLRNPGTLSCMSPRAVEREIKYGELFVVPVLGACFDRMFYRVEHKDSIPSRLRDALAAAMERRLCWDAGCEQQNSPACHWQQCLAPQQGRQFIE